MADFLRPPTAQAAVLGELRARILDGRLPGGAALRQDELAADLGVSRVPVREALRMLEADGHVRYAAHRGYRVTILDIDELEEIYRLRALIEDDLVSRAEAVFTSDARPPATPADGPEPADARAAHLLAVRLAHAELAAQEAAAPPDPAALARANRAFHWAVLRPGPRTDRILRTLWDASEAYRARWFAAPANVAKGAHDHREILAAVEVGDLPRIRALLAAHREAAVAELRDRLAEPGSSSGIMNPYPPKV